LVIKVVLVGLSQVVMPVVVAEQPDILVVVEMVN
jgi:hypothetical protein